MHTYYKDARRRRRKVEKKWLNLDETEIVLSLKHDFFWKLQKFTDESSMKAFLFHKINICLPAGISWKAHGCSIVPKELVAQQYKYPKSLSSSGWYRSTECVSFPEKASLATCKLSTTSQLIKLISPHQHKISYFLIFLSREGDSQSQ